MKHKYSNPRMRLEVADWPWGSKLRTTATFEIETHPTRGQRAIRTTIDPKTGKACKPKTTTYAARVRIVDGDDGRTYILNDAAPYGHYSVMQSNLQFQEETVNENDPGYAELARLFN